MKRRTRIKDLTGQKLGKLLVLERAPNKKSWTMWKCSCDCGNEYTTYSTHLIRGNVTSCGCDSHKKGCDHLQWTGCGEISGRRWNSIRRMSSKRKTRLNVPFEIDIKYAWNLFLTQNRKCALSGQNIFFGKTSKDDTTASLDKIDNNKGYIPGNVQWIHKDINRMKNVFSQEYFIKICKLISESCELN